MDSKEFERLFKANFTYLTLYAFQIVKDGEDAKDIVQDFFISLWHSRDRVQILTDFKPYALRAVKYQSWRLLESRQKIDLSFDDLKEGVISALASSEVPVASKLKIRAFLERLPSMRREIFLAYVVDDLSYKEIAAKYNISVNTVKTQMKRVYALTKNAPDISSDKKSEL